MELYSGTSGSYILQSAELLILMECPKTKSLIYRQIGCMTDTETLLSVEIPLKCDKQSCDRTQNMTKCLCGKLEMERRETIGL